MKIKNPYKSELGKGTIILFVMMNIYFFFNFVFHFALGRILGPSDYGVFAVLMSFIYIYAIPSEAIQNLISSYVSKLNIKNEKGKIKFLIKKSLKKSLSISLIIYVLLIPISYVLSIFLKINFFYLLVTNLVIFSTISLPIIRGVLQGRKKFTKLGIGMIVEAVSKLILAIGFVWIGFSILGAMYGVIFGLLLSFILTYEFNRDILKEKGVGDKFENIKLESIPYFISMIVIVLMFSVDIIIAKLFFSPEETGKYAVLSMLGKMIYFGTSAIGKVMFPIASEKYENNESSRNVFFKSGGVIFIICLLSIIIYGLFPELIINILFGEKYIEVKEYLIYSAIGFSLLALTNFVILFKLSTKKLKYPIVLFIFLGIEILLFFIFNDSLKEFIMSFMISNLIFFIYSILSLLKR